MLALEKLADVVDFGFEGKQVVHIGKRTYLHVFIAYFDVKVTAKRIQLGVKHFQHLHDFFLFHWLPNFFLFARIILNNLLNTRTFSFLGGGIGDRIYSGNLNDRHGDRVEAFRVGILSRQVVVYLLNFQCRLASSFLHLWQG